MTKILSSEYTARKGNVELYMFRKRHSEFSEAKQESKPLLFLVHGSSMSARTSFDLTVPGQKDYSTMDVFASYGFDVWTMDHEGYGRSSHTDGNSDIASGVEDLKAGVEVVKRETGIEQYAFVGQSSGALRAAAFANACPARVERLVLAALVWTGKGSPTLAKRRERLEEWRSSNRRAVDLEFYKSIHNRDKPGLSDDAVPAAMAEAEKPYGGTVPTGTYYDMCAKLPLVDPHKIHCPVMIIRGEHDGIASIEDVIAFYNELPSNDKHFVTLLGQAHSTTLGINRHRFWHVLNAFLTLPLRRDGLAGS
ncbi:MAG: alpha/beta fold hydrolase [Deltaproteobacteria bacterium]|nr:alpha/beta fold hydrolase [Deltaproteobacteria bacterium]